MNKDENLLIGDSGPNVTLLQSLLKLNGFYPMLITGVYGPDTNYFVQKFNKTYSINEDNAQTSTFNKLYELTNDNEVIDEVLNYPTIQIGDSGEYVTMLQTKLSDMEYFENEITGYFDDALKTSVQTFQFINKLVTDGIVGINTWSSLINLYTPLSTCENESTNENTYTVQSGDTLYKIASLYNLTVNELKEINNLTSDNIQPGQVLNLVKENNSFIYTVKANDTLYGLSLTYNMSIDQIKSLNNLTTDVLYIGQTLLLYELDNESNNSDENNSYTVVAGDTLYSIAKKFNTTVQNLTQINNLTTDVLSVGQILITNSDNDDSFDDTDYDYYKVISEDTLYKIATKYNMTVAQLVEINNLSSDILSIGQTLKVYKSDDVLYTILSGDTLYSIANKFGVTVDYLITKNNLTSLILSIGQILYI